MFERDRVDMICDSKNIGRRLQNNIGYAEKIMDGGVAMLRIKTEIT